MKDSDIEKNPDADGGAVDDLDRRITGLSDEVRRLRELLEHLRLQQYLQAVVNMRYIMWRSFVGGVFSGLGAVLGGTLVLALLVYLLSRLEVVPYIGHFVARIVQIVHAQKR
jgi:hypothetical protein